MKLVYTKKKNLDDYEKTVDSGLVKEIRKSAKKLKGKKILHINAISSGGGVAEILAWMTPLMKEAGLDAEWRTIKAPGEFFDVTKLFHNALQGKDVNLTASMEKIYLRSSKSNAKFFKKINNYDFVVIHDPQPAGLINFVEKPEKQKWIWRCHIDTQSPSKEVWNFLRPSLEKYDAGIFSKKEYIRKELKLKKIAIIAPAIDPLAVKNKKLPLKTIERITKHYKLDINRPIISQVSRFDYWKDPLGVVNAYKIVKKKIPSVQLVLMGNIPEDDPEGWKLLDEVKQKSNHDPDLHIIHTSCEDPRLDLKVNAIQTVSQVVIQKSLKEAFGLTVSEALWKEKAVVGGNTGGIILQIKNKKNGFLVNSVEECAQKIIWLLENPKQAKKMGKQAKETVRKEFTCLRYLKDYLDFLNKL